MAGSFEYFLYKSDPDDQGEVKAKVVRLDESNTRALGYVPVTAAELAALPDKRLKKLDGTERFIQLQAVTAGGRTLSRSLIVPDVTDTLFQNGGSVTLPVLAGGTNSTVENLVFTVTKSTGETKSFVRIGDSGLNDGT